MVYPLLDYMETGGSIADRVWERSGMGPADVDVALLYDGFSPSVYYWLESAGFCAQGEAHQFIQDGRIERTGQLPVNTHGGALSEGRLPFHRPIWPKGCIRLPAGPENGRLPAAARHT